MSATFCAVLARSRSALLWASVDTHVSVTSAVYLQDRSIALS
jgi:hypothetical protein